MNALVPASYVLVPCPECNGEGVAEGVVGSYFDGHMKCWYPVEDVCECARCHGEGELEVTFEVDWEAAA